jgi:hypothetical protein
MYLITKNVSYLYTSNKAKDKKITIMTTYKIQIIENEFLETKTFNIVETETIEGKRYSDILYIYDNLNQAESKLDLLNILND